MFPITDKLLINVSCLYDDINLHCSCMMHRKSSFIPTIDFYEQVNDGHPRIGLNLGLLPYYSTEDTASDRLGKRQRSGSPSSQVPMCQAEGCKADLSAAKHYHRRHKVCEFHSKAPTVIAGGHTQRFCQQCSRYAPILWEWWQSNLFESTLVNRTIEIWVY